MYFLLIFLLLLLFVCNLILFRNDIFCPPVAVNATFLICLLVALVRYSDWNLASYGWQATSCIVGCLMIFTAVSYCVYCLFPQKSGTHGLRYYRNRIDVSNRYFAIALAANIFTFCWAALYIRQTVTVRFSIAEFSKMVVTFRRMAQDRTLSIPQALQLLRMFFWPLSIVSLFIFLHNLCFRVKKKRDNLHLPIIVLGMGTHVLLAGGGRLYLLSAISMGFYMAFFFINMRFGFNRKINNKIIKYVILGFALLMILFVLSTIPLGRYRSLSDLNIRKYLSTYISGGVRNLDLFFQGRAVKNDFPGSETFTAIYNNFVPGFDKGRVLEFRNVAGVNTGNIYTSFRRFYSDFGLPGLISLTAIQALLTSLLYFTVKASAQRGRFSFLLLLFCYFSDTVFYMAIEDTFYSANFGIGTCFRVFCLYCGYHLLAKQDLLLLYNKRRVI